MALALTVCSTICRLIFLGESLYYKMDYNHSICLVVLRINHRKALVAVVDIHII